MLEDPCRLAVKRAQALGRPTARVTSFTVDNDTGRRRFLQTVDQAQAGLLLPHRRWPTIPEKHFAPGDLQIGRCSAGTDPASYADRLCATCLKINHAFTFIL